MTACGIVYQLAFSFFTHWFVWPSPPADALLHFPAAAVGGDVGEGESAVDHQAAELKRFGVEVVASAERAGCRTHI